MFDMTNLNLWGTEVGEVEQGTEGRKERGESRFEGNGR